MSRKVWRRPIPAQLGDVIARAVGRADFVLPEETRIEALDALGEGKHPAVIGHVAYLCVVGPPAVRRAAGDAVATLARLLVDDDLVELDSGVRDRSPWSNRGYGLEQQAWWQLQPRNFLRLLSESARPGLVAAICSMHRSGHVRQAAVEAMNPPTADQIGYVLLRSTDWVPQVRDAANRLLTNGLGRYHADEAVRLLPVLQRVQSRLRGADSSGIAAIEVLIRSPLGQRALWTAVTSGTRALRRLAAQSLPEPDLARLAPLALNTGDPVLAAWFAGEAVGRRGAEEQRALLGALEASRHPRVRVLALRWVADNAPAELPSRLPMALLDRSSAVRQCAQFYCRKLGRDPADEYRRRIRTTDTASTKVEVLGLGECGRAVDARLLPRLVTHAHGGVARAALRSIGRLHPGPYAQLFVASLSDPRRGMSREARDALLRTRLVPAAAVLWHLIDGQGPVHAAIHAAALLRGCSKWDAAPVLLRATACENEYVSRVAASALARWRVDHRVRSYSVPPTAVENAAYLTALAECGEAADRRLRSLGLLARNRE